VILPGKERKREPVTWREKKGRSEDLRRKEKISDIPSTGGGLIDSGEGQNV